MGFSEQRRYTRVTVDFFADWGWGPECEYYDKITSLSISGCFLATKRELNAGDEIYIRWTADRLGMISLKGAVRYQLRVVEGAPPTGVGIEFVEMSAPNQQKMQAILSQDG
jgi:PilZ domain-containing protein